MTLKLTAQGEALPSKGGFGPNSTYEEKGVTEISHMMIPVFVKLSIWMIVTCLLLCMSSLHGQGSINSPLHNLLFPLYKSSLMLGSGTQASET